VIVGKSHVQLHYLFAEFMVNMILQIINRFRCADFQSASCNTYISPGTEHNSTILWFCFWKERKTWTSGIRYHWTRYSVRSLRSDSSTRPGSATIDVSVIVLFRCQAYM